MSLVFRIHNAYAHIKRFGFRCSTLRFMLRSRFGKGNGEVRFAPEKLKYPLYLRKNTSDTLVFDQVMLAREYDIPLRSAPLTIVDCGANIGLVSVYWKNIYPEAKIVCVEPEESNYELLQRNLAPYDSVFTVKAGLWPRSANLRIENPEGSCYGFRVVQTDGEGIKAVTVRELMDKYGLETIDILKIDIEGSEKEIFEENYESWLPYVKVLVIELHDRSKPGCSHAVLKTLAGYNFDMIIRGENLIFYFKDK